MLGLQADDVPGLVFPVAVAILFVEAQQSWFNPIIPRNSPPAVSQGLAAVAGLLIGLVFYHLNPWDPVFDWLYSWKGRWIGFRSAPLVVMPNPERLVEARKKAIMAGVAPRIEGLYFESEELIDSDPIRQASPEAKKANRLMTASKACRAIVLPTIVLSLFEVWQSIQSSAGHPLTWSQATDSGLLFWLSTLVFGFAFLVPYVTLRVESMIQRYRYAAAIAIERASDKAKGASPVGELPKKAALEQRVQLAAEAAHNIAGRLRALGRALIQFDERARAGKDSLTTHAPSRWFLLLQRGEVADRRLASVHKEWESEDLTTIMPALVELENVRRELSFAVAGGRIFIDSVLKSVEESPPVGRIVEPLDRALDCCTTAYIEYWPSEECWMPLLRPEHKSWQSDRLRQTRTALDADLATVKEWHERLLNQDRCAVAGETGS